MISLEMRYSLLWLMIFFWGFGINGLRAQDDPFATPRAKKGETVFPEWEEARVIQVRLDVDSIELPLAQADALIRGMSADLDGGRQAREVALQAVAAGRGSRLHRQFLTIPMASKTQSESVQEYPYPTGFQPPMIGEISKPGPPATVEPYFVPPTPQSFSRFNLGYTLAAEVLGEPGSGVVNVNLSHQWTGLVGEHTWSRDYAEVRQPTLHHCHFEGRFPIKRGGWCLAAVLRRPTAEAGGVGGEFVTGRVLTFVRAMWEDPITPSAAPPRAPAPPAPTAAGVLHEWIEISRPEAVALLAQYPNSKQSGALRNALQDRMEKGQASLLEISYGMVGNGQSAKIRSVTDIKNATEFDPAQGSGQSQGSPPAPATLPRMERTFFGLAPRIPVTFETLTTGTETELNLAIDGNDRPVFLNSKTRMVRLAGVRCHGEGGQETQRLETVECPADFSGLLPARQARLIASMDAPPPASLRELRGPAPLIAPEKTLLVFVTVLP